jgi:hypothetical protein
LGFLVDISERDGYIFYYNIEKLIKSGVNENVLKVIGEDNQKLLPRNRGDYAKMALYNKDTKTVTDVVNRYDIDGICATVNEAWAEEILALAKSYCPVDSGALRDSGHIEKMEDGSCRVVFDKSYAWYVHEFTWRYHKLPTQAKFLDRAVFEVLRDHGIVFDRGTGFL